MYYPKAILLISGKRKSGKDYVSLILERELPDSNVIHISIPIKQYWANLHNLDYKLLCSNDDYKENYRKEMIKWSDEMRKSSPGYFCKLAVDSLSSIKRVWIISDIRRKTDIYWFQEMYPTAIQLCIRINADEETRVQRGWRYDSEIDNSISECDLDYFPNWDFVIMNSTENNNLNLIVKKIKDLIL